MDKIANATSSERVRLPLSQAELKTLYDYVERREVGEQGFRSSIASMYTRNARWSNTLVDLATRVAASILQPRGGSVKFYFWGTRFQEIILGLPRHEVCIIGGPKQALFCLRYNIPFLANMRLWGLLAQGLQPNGKQDGVVVEIIEESALDLKGKACKSAVLVVDNDSLPVQRAMILAGRLANLKSVCIQHGIFQSMSAGHILDGWFADQLLVINDHQRSMLIAKGMEAQKINVMGFHSSPYVPRRPVAPVGQRKVCFLGQPWNKYGAERAHYYLEIVGKAAKALHEAGIEMVFKPHPWERGSMHLRLIKNVVDISLQVAFEKYDVFISLTSTALIEARGAGRVAIQIMDSHFDADDLSVHGGIYSVNTSNNDHWSVDLLTALGGPAPIPDHSSPPSKRFVETLTS